MPSLTTPTEPQYRSACFDGIAVRVRESAGPKDAADVFPAGNPASAHILELADRCSEIADQMDNFAGGRRRAALLAMPAFIELVREFAGRFERLVEAVDPLQVADLPWRHLVADARLLKALEVGLAAERRHLEARALKQFLNGLPVNAPLGADFLEPR